MDDVDAAVSITRQDRKKTAGKGETIVAEARGLARIGEHLAPSVMGRAEWADYSDHSSATKTDREVSGRHVMLSFHEIYEDQRTPADRFDPKTYRITDYHADICLSSKVIKQMFMMLVASGGVELTDTEVKKIVGQALRQRRQAAR